MAQKAKFNINTFFDKLFNGITEGRLVENIPVDEIYRLLAEAKRIFASQPMLLKLGVPINICGDLHGQFNDLMRIMDSEGFPHVRSYLFLGDYVRYPKNFYMLRGNHETSSINRAYGFQRNIMELYKSDALYDAFNRVFDYMPLAAVIAGRILCMHGGLSPSLTTAASLDVIDAIERPLTDQQINQTTNELAVNLLWADPDVNTVGFEKNRRGVGHIFGQRVIDQVRARHGIDLIIRAHQVVLDGYEFFNGTADSGLITIFTAPHYCGMYDNSGAIVRVANDLGISFKKFEPQFRNRG
ncbi:Serine/threonine-protein phosphatase [Meloidogyne graminicola]|uniref:Serine/threonine-protein phosphatase n=1 Tax=Meloidogyne graminicola TaxID=189291 RepID=A0A8S9ZDX3_9BILA|nr:Serine/threonine-protein phosphatase [Meloidogyne graminicola]